MDGISKSIVTAKKSENEKLFKKILRKGTKNLNYTNVSYPKSSLPLDFICPEDFLIRRPLR